MTITNKLQLLNDLLCLSLGETPVCEVSSGKCIPCDDSQDETKCSAGTFCSAGKCIECSSSGDCDEEKPVCNADGQCVSCGLYEDICPTEEKPVCQLQSGQCLACSDEEGLACPFAADGQFCDDGKCVFSCETSQDCPDDKKQICNTENECRGCESKQECVERYDLDNIGQPANSNWQCNAGKCVENTFRFLDLIRTYSNLTRTTPCPDMPCPTDKPICENDICVECTTNSDCPADKKICHEKACSEKTCSELYPLQPEWKEDTQECVECISTEDNKCSELNFEKPICNTATNKCIECLETSDCDPRLGSCINGVCTTSCTAHNQCVHPAKLNCNFATRQCEGGDFLAAFTLRSLSETAIKRRMDNTEKGITNAQTSGTSVAQIYGDTR